MQTFLNTEYMSTEELLEIVKERTDQDCVSVAKLVLKLRETKAPCLIRFCQHPLWAHCVRWTEPVFIQECSVYDFLRHGSKHNDWQEKIDIFQLVTEEEISVPVEVVDDALLVIGDDPLYEKLRTELRGRKRDYL